MNKKNILTAADSSNQQIVDAAIGSAEGMTFAEQRSAMITYLVGIGLSSREAARFVTLIQIQDPTNEEEKFIHGIRRSIDTILEGD